QDRVVDVVLVGRDQVGIALVGCLLVAVAVNDELEFGPGQRNPASLGQPCDLRLQDLARRGGYGSPIQPGQVREDQGGGGQPWHATQGRQVGLEHEVAVAALPRGHLVPADGVHVYVHCQQVVAALRVVLGHLVEEVLRRQTLASQPALHVG